jgi:hypothetical protein
LTFPLGSFSVSIMPGVKDNIGRNFYHAESLR